MGKAVVISAEAVEKSFKSGEGHIKVLRGINLEIHSGDFAVIFGPSGCGKSTLLNILLGIDTPSSGQVHVRDVNIATLSEDDRASFRSKKMGMVHQMPYWVKSIDVANNIALPLIIKGEKQDKALKKANQLLHDIGIPRLNKKIPTQLSGGEQQRVGIARALICEPWIVLADEPTGNLDSEAGEEIMKLFGKLNREQGRTILLVTHNDRYWNAGNRRIEMEDGQIIKDTRHKDNQE